MTIVQSGNLAAVYQPIAPSMTAYFTKVNEEDGGVCERDIVLKVEDDQYNPAQGLEKARKLAEQDLVEHAPYRGVTLTDAEHMMATRLWQNTAKVHFNTEARPDGTRLVYGGHVISMARALSFNGLANAQLIAAINAGAHTSPAFAGDTVYAWSEVLDKAEVSDSVGALRLRLVATKGRDESMTLKGEDGKYAEGVLLDLDYWVLIPR